MYEVYKRIEDSEGRVIGYVLHNVISDEYSNIRIEEVHKFHVTNAVIDKNGMYRAKKGCIIENEPSDYDGGTQIRSRRPAALVGKAAMIVHSADARLSTKQKRLLDLLSKETDIMINKADEKMRINMNDMCALTAWTGLEMSLFERPDKYIVCKGTKNAIILSDELTDILVNGKYNWIGHTHPGATRLVLIESDDDVRTLIKLNQKQSTIYNSVGMYITFSI